MEELMKQLLTEMKAMKQELTAVKQSQAQMEEKINIKLDQVDFRIIKLESDIKSRVDNLGKKIDQLAYEGQEDVKAMIQLLDKKIDDHIETKLDQILTTQTIQGESINLRALQQLRTAAEVEVLKKAK